MARTRTDGDVVLQVLVAGENLSALEEGVTLGVDALTGGEIRLQLERQPDGTHALAVETGPVAFTNTPKPVDAERVDEGMWDHEAIHLWFNLTYANYLVVPRSVLQSMPDDWQKRFVLCLNEMQEAFGHLDWPDYNVRTLKRAPEFIQAFEDCGECDGEGAVAEGQRCEHCEGTGEDESQEERRYETPEEVGFRIDPIPHYNRGRTRLEPKVEARP